MQDFAYAFAAQAILRTGGAPGADLAFEFGARTGGGVVELFLPWSGFNGCLNNELLSEPSEQAYEIAKCYHPGWDYLKPEAKKLIARNSHQILGKDLDDPVDMIICWTSDGTLTGKTKKSGGTGQALRIACDYPVIEVLNLKRPEHLEWVREAVATDGMSC